MKNNKINLNSFIKILVLDFKSIIRNFIFCIIIFLILFFLFWKNESNRFTIDANIRPMSFINFTKIFTYEDVELIVEDGEHKRTLNSRDDSFTNRRLTPLVIFYHFVSILEDQFDEAFVNDKKNNKKFIYFEKIWNHQHLIYNFEIRAFGNNPVFLKDKFNEVIKNSTFFLKKDLVDYLEKYKKQSINNPEKIKKINSTIEQLKNSENVLRIYTSRINSVMDKNLLICLLGLTISLILSVCIQLIIRDLRSSKNK